MRDTHIKVAGPVLSFRRPSPPFAFVEYSDPESVLRCLSVVNGTMLKSKNGAEKALLVKADEKTRARLDEYEKTRELSEVRFSICSPARVRNINLTPNVTPVELHRFD